GSTRSAICREGGASSTHGELSSRSKYTAPVRRMARSTSERTSVFTKTLRTPDARTCASDGRTCRHNSQPGCKIKRTLAHGTDGRAQHTLGDLPTKKVKDMRNRMRIVGALALLATACGNKTEADAPAGGTPDQIGRAHV